MIQYAKAPQKAAPKDVMSKPLTMVETSQNISALIMNVNMPKVKMLIGRVRIIIIGRITAFTSPKISEAIKAAQKEVKLTPGTRLATNKRTKVFKIQRSKNIIIFS